MQPKFPIRRIPSNEQKQNRRIIPASECSIKDCHNPVYDKCPGRGWCSAHYKRWWRNGNPMIAHKVQKYQDGRTSHPLYCVWKSMRDRCTRPTNREYPAYGGRGIKVAPEFLGPNGFANFLHELGERPGNGQEWQVDRIDNDGDYAPGNIRWANKMMQSNNTQMANKVRKSAIYDGFSATFIADIRTNQGKFKFRFSSVKELKEFMNNLIQEQEDNNE